MNDQPETSVDQIRADARAHRRTDPEYLRGMCAQSGLSMREIAERLGVSIRTLRYYLSGNRRYPYTVQYTMERIALDAHEVKWSTPPLPHTSRNYST